LRQVPPGTREQRCWWHKQANVLAALAKSAHPSASTTLRDVCNAEAIDTAQAAVKTFELDYAAKYRNAVAKITSPTTSTRCASSTNVRPSAGFTCESPTRSKVLSQQ
jgi:transposase-like protein